LGWLINEEDLPHPRLAAGTVMLQSKPMRPRVWFSICHLIGGTTFIFSSLKTFLIHSLSGRFIKQAQFNPQKSFPKVNGIVYLSPANREIYVSLFYLTLRRLLVAIYLFCVTTPAFSQAPASDSSSHIPVETPTSQETPDGQQEQAPSFADQLQIADLYQQIEELRKLNKDLSTRLTDWKAVKPTEQSNQPAPVLTNTVEQFNNAFAKLIALPADSVLTPDTEEAGSLLSAARALDQMVRAPYLDFYQSQLNTYGFDNSPAEKICNTLLQKMRPQATDFPSFADGMIPLFRKLPQSSPFQNAVNIKRSEIQPEIDQAQKSMPMKAEILNSMLQQNERAFDANLQASVVSLDQKIKDNEHEIANLNAQADSLSHSLQGRQGILTTYLLYVIPIMVLLVAMALYFLHVYPPKLATVLIRERSIVELVSVTFLFVSILFLGAGGFVEKGVLGTLLGTVAG
jgi:cell division septum initiation protein DivIVA